MRLDRRNSHPPCVRVQITTVRDSLFWSLEKRKRGVWSDDVQAEERRGCFVFMMFRDFRKRILILVTFKGVTFEGCEGCPVMVLKLCNESYL